MKDVRRFVYDEIIELAAGIEVGRGHVACCFLAQANKCGGVVGKQLRAAACQVEIRQIPSRHEKSRLVQYRLYGCRSEKDDGAREDVEDRLLLRLRKEPHAPSVRPWCG